MATFNFAYSQGIAKEITPRIIQAKFGDGYEQRVGDGINVQMRMYSVTFAGKDTTTADSIENFLIARGGLESFNWTPPTGSAGVFICRSWRRTYDTYNTSTITATFEEVFGETPAP